MLEGYSALIVLVGLTGIIVLSLVKIRSSLAGPDQDGLRDKLGIVGIFRKKTDVLEADEDGRTLLMQAAAQGFEDGVEYILVMGGQESVNRATNDGTTALHCAMASGNPAVIARLLSFGADPNLADRQGRTPLWLAAKQENASVVALLLDYQADPNCRVGEQMMTPLMIAAKKGRVRVAATLIKRGADPLLGNSHGKTAADFAREHLDTNRGSNSEQNRKLLRMVLYLESLSSEQKR